MPSGMLMVTDSAFTVFEAAFVLVPAASALAGAAAFAGVTFGADGALCPTAIKLHISMSHPERTIFFILVPFHSTAHSVYGVAAACATNHRHSADASPRGAGVALRAGIPVVTSGPVRPGRIGAQSGHGIADSSDVALVAGGA